MAQWKKVIVSGSTANLAALQVDNLTSGQVVIGGGASNLSTTAINGTGNILGTTGATGVSMTGSFTGSFTGNGSGLTGVTATAIFPVIAVTNVTSTDKFFISQSNGQEYITYGNLLTDLAGTNLAVEGSDSLTLASTITGLTSISSTSFTGSLQGNATTATSATTATTATNATNTAVTDTTTGTGPYYLTFTAASTGNTPQLVDSTGLTYNATTNTITATASYASQANTATTATTATTVSSISSNITNNTNNYVLTATGGGSINGEANLAFDGTTLTVTGNEVITGNLTVQGTASFQSTTNTLVADRFVLFASGSTTTGDGGIVVQQATQNVGELFGYENSINRWGFTSSFDASNPSYTAAAMVTTTEVGTASPSVAPIYGGSSNGYGNMYVKTDTGDIFIYA